MQRSRPFARAHAMMVMIAAAFALTGSAKDSAIAAIPPYKSRGKGRRGNGSQSVNFYKSRSKYMPHIGAKESAKAVARLAAAK